MIALRDRLLPERIFLLHSKDYTGYLAYYFLYVDSTRLPLFKRAVSGKASFDLEDFGEVIASGYGEASDEIRAAIHKKYGWNSH